MHEMLLTLFGAILGFLGAIVGGHISYRRERQKEIKEFYSWVCYLLYRLLERKEIDKLKVSLTATPLHYSFNRIWAQIPAQKDNINIRELIYRFIKGGDDLNTIYNQDEFKKLYAWLEKESK